MYNTYNTRPPSPMYMPLEVLIHVHVIKHTTLEVLVHVHVIKHTTLEVLIHVHVIKHTTLEVLVHVHVHVQQVRSRKAWERVYLYSHL